MDPLSVAASVFTVLSAAKAAIKALKHISQLRSAPDHLVALRDEVTGLHEVLHYAQQAIEYRNDTSQDCGRLPHMVEQAGQAVDELNYLIEHHLVSSGVSPGLDEKPKASRAAFF